MKTNYSFGDFVVVDERRIGRFVKPKNSKVAYVCCYAHSFPNEIPYSCFRLVEPEEIDECRYKHLIGDGIFKSEEDSDD